MNKPVVNKPTVSKPTPRSRPVGVDPVARSDESDKPARSRNLPRLLLIGGIAVAIIACVVLTMAWAPIQRSRQLDALDACRDGNRTEEGRQLAVAFAQEWGARSVYVVDAIRNGRGPLEARIELCRAGNHLRLLDQLLSDDQLTPTQRGLVCAALSEQWPSDGSGPGASPRLQAWALAPESEPILAEPALRLLVAIAAPDAEAQLTRAIADQRLTSERVVAIAVALERVAQSRGNSGISALIGALEGPHRAALLASPPLIESVRDYSQAADAPMLLGLLTRPDSLRLGLAGLASKRFQLADSDRATRASLATALAPFLTVDAADAELGEALLIIHRQRLVGLHAEVLALLPRLATRRPPPLTANDLADLLGKSLVSTKTPEAAAAAEVVVAALTAALEQERTKNLAIVALSRVQDAQVAALHQALDGLASHGSDGADALSILVSKTYARDDIAQAGRRRGWAPVLADDRRRRAQYDSMTRWLSEHAEETTARSDSAVMAENKVELGRMRDELRRWLESTDPPPLGLTKAMLDERSNRVQLMLSMVIKATHTD